MSNLVRQKETDLQLQWMKISQPYRCRRSFLSIGIWDKTSRMVEIIHQHRSASKFFVFMGINKQSKIFLYPEEALFMMQCSVLQVTLWNKDSPAKIPLSFDEAYSLWFNRSDDIHLIHLHVYQYLTRFGFILRRHRSLTTSTEINQPKKIVKKKSSKRKRPDSSTERKERQTIQGEQQINDQMEVFSESSESERLWFPDYTSEISDQMTPSPRLIFPEHFQPVHIDWLPADFNEKVAKVELSMHENRHDRTPRPSFSLLRSNDLQSHSSIYHRLSTRLCFSSPENQSTSSIFYDMYKPSKHFRKTQPDAADFFLQIKDSQTPFRFDEIYDEQHEKTLTAIVHHGDVSFFSFQTFDPLERLQFD